jgi:hypothetical protein
MYNTHSNSYEERKVTEIALHLKSNASSEMMNDTEDFLKREWILYQAQLTVQTKSCVQGALLRQSTNLNIPTSK